MRDFGGTAIFGDATRKHSLNDRGKRAAIIIGEPKHGFNKMGRKGLFVNFTQDSFSFERRLASLARDDTDDGLFAERNFNYMAR